MAVLDQVVHALLATGIPREPACLAELLEPGLATGDDLVHVGLMAGVPQDGVEGRLEHAVERQGQFDCAEI